jgi:hypothetical protein
LFFERFKRNRPKLYKARRFGTDLTRRHAEACWAKRNTAPDGAKGLETWAWLVNWEEGLPFCGSLSYGFEPVLTDEHE